MDEGGENKQAAKSSSSKDEADSPRQANEDTGGGGRFYKCMFCRGGFTTAQALGGHMNIHRKERARLRLNEALSSVSINNEGEGSGSSTGGGRGRTASYYDLNNMDINYNYQQLISNPPVSEPNLINILPSSSCSSPSSASQSLQAARPSELSLFGENNYAVENINAEEMKEDKEEIEELDLELRLGHGP